VLSGAAAGVDGALGVVAEGVAEAEGVAVRLEAAVQPARTRRGTISSGRRMEKILVREERLELEP
jgi:hypothetical protein